MYNESPCVNEYWILRTFKLILDTCNNKKIYETSKLLYFIRWLYLLAVVSFKSNKMVKMQPFHLFTNDFCPFFPCEYLLYAAFLYT